MSDYDSRSMHKLGWDPILRDVYPATVKCPKCHEVGLPQGHDCIESLNERFKVLWQEIQLLKKAAMK